MALSAESIELQQRIESGEVMHFATVNSPPIFMPDHEIQREANGGFFTFLRETYGADNVILHYAFDEHRGKIDKVPDRIGAYVVTAAFEAVHGGIDTVPFLLEVSKFLDANWRETQLLQLCCPNCLSSHVQVGDQAEIDQKTWSTVFKCPDCDLEELKILPLAKMSLLDEAVDRAKATEEQALQEQDHNLPHTN